MRAGSELNERLGVDSSMCEAITELPADVGAKKRPARLIPGTWLGERRDRTKGAKPTRPTAGRPMKLALTDSPKRTAERSQAQTRQATGFGRHEKEPNQSQKTDPEEQRKARQFAEQRPPNGSS